MNRPVFLTVCITFILSMLLYCVKDDDPVVVEFSITADTLVDIRDTFTIAVESEEPVLSDVRYCFVRSPWFTPDTSDQPVIKMVWQITDTGSQRVIVYAIKGDDVVSSSETLYVSVKAHNPSVNAPENSRAGINKTYAYKSTAGDSDGNVIYLEWAKDNQAAVVMHPESLLYIYWGLRDTGVHHFTVTAVDNDGLRSSPDSFWIDVGSRLPMVKSVEGDTSISIGDTLKLVLTGDDPDGYITSFTVTDERSPLVTTAVTTKLFTRVWGGSDTGLHRLRIQAIDNDGRRSEPVNVSVTVTSMIPEISLTCPATVVVGDTSLLKAFASDNDGKIVRYEWTISASKGDDSFGSSDSLVKYVWNRPDTGSKVVSVYAIDDDGLKSAVVHCTLTVVDDRPVLKKYLDNTVSSIDTFRLIRQLVDTSRSIKCYVWEVLGSDSKDSSTIQELTLYYTGTQHIKIIVTAVDTANASFTDTVRITFNRPPVVTTFPLVNNDTLWTGEKNVPGTIKCKFHIFDPDSDKVAASFFWGRGEHTDSLDAGDSVVLKIDSVGLYNWKIILKDSFGNISEKTGSTHIGIEHTICFAGHSIVTGLGMVGAERVDSAGFRPRVLDGLRSKLKPYERLRAVGPFSPGVMYWRPNDDSCFAISGSFAREMLLLMDHAYTNLSADIWVMMLGVNGSFSGIESQASIELVKRMFTRNPDARVYVLTSQPFEGIGNYIRVSYNRILRDTVAALNSRGLNAFVVESGDSILTSNNEFNDTLAWDAVHPNLEGYRRLGNGILDVMFNRIPNVIPLKEDEIE